MKRWRGWGELVIGIHRNLRDAVKGMRCVGAGIGYHEVLRDTRRRASCAGWWRSWCRGWVMLNIQNSGLLLSFGFLAPWPGYAFWSWTRRL